MSTLSDAIERYLKLRLSGALEGVIEIRRSEIAERFSCVPSQINYVLETRFTPQRGYYVESRRGGGGYIRILRAVVEHPGYSWEDLRSEIGSRITSKESDAVLHRLVELGILTELRATLIRNVLRQETSDVELPRRDYLRAALLRSMLLVLLHDRDDAQRR